MKNLKPCPFCGKTPKLLKHIVFGCHYYAVQCNSCNISMNGIGTVDYDETYLKTSQLDLISKWNERNK